jgi:hypothetical protein
MATRQFNATEGRVYGGDCGLIHIADGERASVGYTLATWLDSHMRADAISSGRRTREEADAQDLCPGCYMVALFNAAVTLAQQNGQTLQELGDSMAEAFHHLATGGADRIEHINVVLDARGDK